MPSHCVSGATKRPKAPPKHRGSSPVQTQLPMAESLRTTGVRSVYLPQHIVVLVHGNNGSAADFDAVEAALQAKFGERQMLIIKSRANEPDTSLGVEIGGTRLAKEVVETVFEYELSPVVSSYKLSVIGHSLGGLYARYAVVQIMNALSCLHVEYVDFVTICTPHLGSRRARGPSTVKNILRLGVHKVLSSRSIYGQTGIDLLLDAQAQQQQEGVTDADAVEPARPLLEVMSDPESEFVRSLKRFRHGTLVAMTDGDVVVPYPSASMRSYSPYVSTFLTERYMDWRWHVRHSGFCQTDDNGITHPAYATFLERLNSKIDSSIEIEEHELGLDATRAPRYPSIEGFDCDNKQEVEFPHEMLCGLQHSIPWRRIDVTVKPCGMKGKMRLHDWPINKMQPPDCRADEFIDLLCDMIGADHQMRPLPTPDTVGMIHESPALALARRLRNAVKRNDGNSTSDSGGADSDADAHHSGTTSPTSGSSVTSSDTNVEHFPVQV
ncbi:hypothetical protein PF005_g1936 [Phytophthora fragariae]|uniref:DUF676 domain-containing protein n=1 Tax=Phytophthora fragariae TaxID=53985 RepID=A0A6A3FSK9_9STRA|nr:hypothetical protein PF003_g9917 [Phytophthora fragariae]KAE8948539.1 hypothetical protein PF009_g1920 [Phytophthora fragariae]KAE9028251.1 hypothetical protein PF011_g1648 [Phytophthora fragariae]KAE9122640.1 hypothetical protein PF007_g7360 [Phytophthora fragariae]KAE9154522.1 hypothetical protein PF006_g1427 [Phytophthora fragariae]